MKALVEIKAQGRVFGRDHWTYHFCTSCEFIFLDPSERLNSEEEKKRYEAHTNSSGDEGYRQFLFQFAEPVEKIIKERQFKLGLDYGSGPEPALTKIFNDKGFDVKAYDPFFAKEEHLIKAWSLSEPYDFILCHEVIEHCFDPVRDIKKMLKVLRRGGVLAIRTQLHPGPGLLESWHYRRDPTHVSFFQEKTFQVIAQKLNLRIIISGKDFVVFENLNPSSSFLGVRRIFSALYKP